MKQVVELQTINPRSPTQWQGHDSDENPIYVRYGEGYLSVAIGKHGDSIFSAVYGDEIFGRQIGGKLSEAISFDELKAATAGFIQWPKEET